MKHSSDMKFCGCRTCRAGLRHPYGKFVAKSTRRSFRRSTRRLCKLATRNVEIEIPDRISVAYTD